MLRFLYQQFSKPLLAIVIYIAVTIAAFRIARSLEFAETLPVIILIGAPVLIAWFFWPEVFKAKKKIQLPVHLTSKKNDKLILINGGTYDELQAALNSWRAGVDKENDEHYYTTRPRVVRVSNKQSAVLFPYDVDLETFCMLINFLTYPIDVSWEVEVNGWTTIYPDDIGGLISKFQLAVIFVPDNDTTYDYVYAITHNGEGFKIPFGEEIERLDFSISRFIAPPISLADLQQLPFKDIWTDAMT